MTVIDYLNRMVIEATSPDGNVHARVSAGPEVELWFRPGAVDRYTEDRLEHQLSRLASATAAAYLRGQAEAYRRADDIDPAETDGSRSEDPRRRRFTEALNAVRGEGSSARGTVGVRTVGLVRWAVEIRPGTLRRLDEQLLLSELHSALAALLRDREMKITLLKAEIYDLGLPSSWRDAVARRRGRPR